MNSDESRIRVLTVDDHPALQDGLKAMIDDEKDMIVVGVAENGEQAIERFRELKPDVLLIDLQMPKMDGHEAIKAIREEYPDAKIIVFTVYKSDIRAVKALRAGASGYLLKSALRKELIEAIREVYRGQKYIPKDVAKDLVDYASDDQLTDREAEILGLVAAGLGNKEIARKLTISSETVKSHLKKIFEKLGLQDRTKAVMVAAKRGFIEI